MRKLLLPPIVWLASIVLMIILHDLYPMAHSEPETWRSLIGIAMFAVAFGITVFHKILFNIEKTNIDTFASPDKLVESGLFKYIRNPMYLGFVGSLAALALLGGALSPWVLVIGFFILSDRFYIPYEEMAMEEKFGNLYESYKLRTRRWI